MAATDSNDKTASRGDGFPRLFSHELRGSLRNGFRCVKHFKVYRPSHAAWTSVPTTEGVLIIAGVLTAGLFHPSAGTIHWSTSAGPQVPGSYSYTGVFAFNTGSTIRQASST